MKRFAYQHSVVWLGERGCGRNGAIAKAQVLRKVASTSSAKARKVCSGLQRPPWAAAGIRVVGLICLRSLRSDRRGLIRMQNIARPWNYLASLSWTIVNLIRAARKTIPALDDARLRVFLQHDQKIFRSTDGSWAMDMKGKSRCTRVLSRSGIVLYVPNYILCQRCECRQNPSELRQLAQDNLRRLYADDNRRWRHSRLSRAKRDGRTSA
jgi:hypothetical protein